MVDDLAISGGVRRLTEHYGTIKFWLIKSGKVHYPDEWQKRETAV